MMTIMMITKDTQKGDYDDEDEDGDDDDEDDN